jgi:Fanconi anemia group M protein
METTDGILKLWDKLPFSSFYDEKKKLEWHKYALELINGLVAGNTGLIADTGTGKTIMAFLVFKALGLRTLFLTPTVILTGQHADLYKKISGQEALVVNGTKKKRDWDQGQLIIATPHVFIADRAKRLVNENDFDLLVIDEMHKAEGQYPYVPIVKLFIAKSKKILCLSASPGATYEEISEMENLYNIKTWVTAEIDKPETKHRLIKAELSPELEEAEIYFKAAYAETLKSLKDVFESLNKEIIITLDEQNPFLTQDSNNQLEKLTDNLPKPEFYEAKFLFAKQYKLAYLYRILMTEGYATFLRYIYESLTKDKSKAAATILADNGFRKIFLLIKEIQKQKAHPKEEALWSLIKEMDWKDKSCLVFVSSKKTAVYLADWANQLGYKSDTLLGGRNKSVKKQAQVIGDFSKHEIKIIFATSVVEEGLSLPEIDVVVHYNQPMTEISRLQRGGRTGRFYEGLEVFLIMNISYENALYYATLSRLKKMKDIFYESSRKETREKKATKRRKKVELTGQLSLNFSEEPLLF